VPHKGGFASVEELAAARGTQGAVWAVDPADDGAVLAATSPLLEGELDAAEAVYVALLRSPALQASYEDLGVAQADLVQAGLPSNPVLAAAVLPGVSGDLGTQQVYELTQNLLGLLLLPARKDLASREFASTKLRVASEVTSLAAAVRSDYYGLVAGQQLLSVLRLVDEADAAGVAFASSLFDAGNLSERELTSRRALREETRLAVLEAEAETAEARARLARALAADPGEEAWRVPDRLPDLPASDPDPAALEAEAAAQRLDVLAAEAESGALAQALAIARRWRWVPLLEVGVSSERQPEGGWNLGPSLSLALPLFDQGQPDVARLESALRRSVREAAAARLDARSDVREASARLAGARARAAQLRDATLPLRERFVRLTLEEYNYMLVGAFDLLLAKRDEVASYRDYVAALRDYWVARSALEAAVGRRVEADAPAPRAPAPPPPAPDAPAPEDGGAHRHHHHHGGN
jgi:cobalt-zinc-cadmium efflux system outer membrane protein